MTPLQIAATGFGFLTAVVGAVLGVEARYEKVELAAYAHEQLAAEVETDRLQFSLELIKIKLEKFKDLSAVRPLSESELIELRAVEKEYEVILERLATKG